MSLPLQKNKKLSLVKAAETAHLPVRDLRRVIVGAGWDEATRGNSVDIDLFAITEVPKMERVKKGLFKTEFEPTGETLQSVCYFGDKSILSGAIRLDKDNRTGEDDKPKINGRSDDENIFIDFDRLPPQCEKISIYLNLYSPGTRTLAAVKNLFARLHVNGVELLTADISENPEKNNSTAVHYIDFTKNSEGTWDAEFIEKYYKVKSIGELAKLVKQGR